MIYSNSTREWLSGRALPCQGKCRGSESRLPLQTSAYAFPLFLRRDSHVPLAQDKRYSLVTCLRVRCGSTPSDATAIPSPAPIFYMAPSPSGKARVCKTLIPSSILGGASKKPDFSSGFLFFHLLFLFVSAPYHSIQNFLDIKIILDIDKIDIVSVRSFYDDSTELA